MGLYYTLTNGEDIEIRMDDGEITIVLFNGSTTLSYTDNIISLNDIITEVERDYNKYKVEDQSFFYQCNGFYD